MNIIQTPCPSWKPFKRECSKGTDCECVTGQDENIVDFKTERKRK